MYAEAGPTRRVFGLRVRRDTDSVTDCGARVLSCQPCCWTVLARAPACPIRPQPLAQVLVVSHGKAVQVAHELAGGKGRVTSVGYAGMLSMRAKELPAAAQQRREACDAGSRQATERSAKAALRSPSVAFESDPAVGPRKVELDLAGPPW